MEKSTAPTVPLRQLSHKPLSLSLSHCVSLSQSCTTTSPENYMFYITVLFKKTLKMKYKTSTKMVSIWRKKTLINESLGVSERWVMGRNIVGKLQSGFYFFLCPENPSATDISTRRAGAERHYGFQGGSGVGESTPRAKEILKKFCHHANIATLIHRTCTSALNLLQIPLFSMWCQPISFISEIPNNLHRRTFKITKHKGAK